MSDPKLFDIERGGESTQYESIRTFTETPAKQTGQLGSNLSHTRSETQDDVPSDNNNRSLEDEDAELARKLGSGESTAGFPGHVDKDLEPETQGDAAAAKSRRQQGYGPGSGVGA